MRWLVALAVVACSGPRPKASEPEPVIPRIRAPRVPRPTLVFESFRPELSRLPADDLRWPLTRDPVLEPHAPIAALFRSSSPWTALCDARRDPVTYVDRDELLDYLLAWCGGTADLDRLRNALQPLARAKTLQLAQAARLDLVDVLANTPIGAADAERWLNAYHDPKLIDALAATYEAMGHTEAALVVVRQQMRSPWWSRVADCRALYRARALVREPWIRDEIEERKPTDAVCQRVADALDEEDKLRGCPLLARNHPDHDICQVNWCEELELELVACGASLSASPRARIAIAYRHWPKGSHSATVWLAYARFSFDEGDPGAADLAAAAIENASLVADCATELAVVVELARQFQSRVRSPKLDHVARLTPASCERRFSPTLGR